jgi:hypothetical protein
LLVQKKFTYSDQDDFRSEDEAKHNFGTAEGIMTRSGGEAKKGLSLMWFP